MSTHYSDAELLEFSKQIFSQLEKEGKPTDFLYACQDGNLFRDVHQNHASNYARESRQELKRIELVGSVPRIIGSEPEDPMTRDVTALMHTLGVTEDKARELIAEHKGNTAAAVKAQAAPAAPEAKKPATGRKPYTSKNTTNGTA